MVAGVNGCGAGTSKRADPSHDAKMPHGKGEAEVQLMDDDHRSTKR
jgi:hypothetical protein